jgi:hypothetical protein
MNPWPRVSAQWLSLEGSLDRVLKNPIAGLETRATSAGPSYVSPVPHAGAERHKLALPVRGRRRS